METELKPEDFQMVADHYFVEIKNGKVSGKYNADYYGVQERRYLDFAAELITETPEGLKANYYGNTRPETDLLAECDGLVERLVKNWGGNGIEHRTYTEAYEEGATDAIEALQNALRGKGMSFL